MNLKKNLLWIILFGSLIGLNETLIGSFNLPYRSVILSAISITLLSFARMKIPKAGTSILVILIAVLFKINNLGIHTCTANVFLCSPTAILSLGISYEVFASIFLSKNNSGLLNQILTCITTAIVAFSLFGIMNTFILHSWDTNRLYEYIFIRASMTAVASSAITLIGIYTIRILKNHNFGKISPYAINSILSFMIIALWIFGTYTKY
jgi:hypothetical protein